MNKVDKEFIDEMRDYFKRLDTDGTGQLSKSDLITKARSQLHRTSKKLELAQYKEHLLQRAAAARQGNNQRRQSFWQERMSFFASFRASPGHFNMEDLDISDDDDDAEAQQ
jgi:hypothetical protein